MIERSINTKQVNASNATKRLPVTLTASDALNAYEFVLFAAESMQCTIDYEVASMRDRPIVDAMREYVRDARALLARLK